MILSTSLLHLLWAVARSQGYPDAVHLINGLNDFYRFDHHIFFMDSSTDLGCWFQTPLPLSPSFRLTPQTVFTFGNFSDTDYNMTKSSKNPFLIVVVDGLQFDNGSSQLIAQVRAIRAIYVNAKVGVFFAHNISSLDIIEELFRKSWNASIVNIFSAFYMSVESGEPLFNVFTYNPFLTFDLINVTRSVTPLDLFPVPNFRGHPLRIVDIADMHLLQTHINFWSTVLFVFNASFSLEIHNSFTEFLEYGTISTDVYPYESYLVEKDFVVGMTAYPYRQSMYVMIVPHAQPYSDFGAYLRNNTWTLFFVYTLIAIVASSCLLTVSGYLQKKKISLFQCVVDVVNLLINDNSAIRYRNLHRADVFVVVPLTFTGLIVMNGILSLFKSYITSPVYQPQINTIEDLYKSSIPILDNEIFWKDTIVEWMEDITGFGEWNSKVHGISKDQLVNEISPYNKPFAFVEQGERVLSYLEVQNRLALKAYHALSDIYLNKYLLSFRVRPDFPFIDSLNDLVHRLTGAGLIDRWMKEDRKVFTRIVLGLNRNRQIKIGHGSDTDVSAVTTVAWCGWIASAVVFICELICHKIKSYQLMPSTQSNKL